MIHRNPVTLMIGILVSGFAVLAFMTACGGSTDEPEPTPTVSEPAPTVVPTTAPTVVPTTAAPAATTPAGVPDDDLLAQGKLIFEETAGGVGCAWCHGMDGKGNGPSGVGAPANRGASSSMVKEALAGVELMDFIKLNSQEVQAIAAYLQYLNTQP